MKFAWEEEINKVDQKQYTEYILKRFDMDKRHIDEATFEAHPNGRERHDDGASLACSQVSVPEYNRYSDTPVTKCICCQSILEILIILRAKMCYEFLIYLRGTIDAKIIFSWSTLNLQAFSGADWAGELFNNQKSSLRSHNLQ